MSPAVSADQKILIVLPTYIEAENIENVLSQVRANLPAADVLVVDDNSPDDTAGIARRFAEKAGQIEILEREGKSGLGSAYIAGFTWGIERGYDVLVAMDADLQHDPTDLPRIVGPTATGADLVIGSRYVPGGAVPGWSAHRLLLSRLGNAYAKAMLRLSAVDATSGYRAYSAEALKKLNLKAIRADGYGFQIEMAYRINSNGGHLREVPITFIERVEGKSKMSGRIVVEALGLVTAWGIKRRLRALAAKKRN